MILDLTLFDAVEVDFCVELWGSANQSDTSSYVEAYGSKEEAEADMSAFDVKETYWSVFLRYKDGGDMHGRECLCDMPTKEQAEHVAQLMECAIAYHQ